MPFEQAPSELVPLNVQGRLMVFLAECESLDKLHEEIEDAWHNLGEVVIVDHDGKRVVQQ